ncbi:MAG: hypothetical protein IAF02_16650, partial [Anaerolineae bacterium]|nr:hypothetical protein [Anaerolineae bacterium]
HMVNILVGEGAPEYGDLDNSGLAENPGDGVGVRGYLQQMAAQLATVEPDSAERHYYTTLATAAVDNSLTLIDELLNKASKIIAADTATEALMTREEMEPLLALLLTGIDKDENGVPDSLLGEGGIEALPALIKAAAHWAIVEQ